MSGATPSGLTSHYSIKKFADHADPEAWQLNDNYDVIDSKIYEATIADIYTSTSPIIKSIANVFSLNYSAANLRNNSNYLDTIQDIATTSSPLFTSLTLANNLTISNGLISLAKNSDGVFYGSVYSDTNWQNARILLQRARGTIASPTAVQNGDQLATFDLFAYAPSGSFQRTTGANGLTFLVDGVPSASTVPAKAIIGGLTIKASGNVISDGLITANSGIYSIGNVGIGTTASYPLDIQINSATDEVLLNISNTNGDNAARSANIQLGCGGYINTFLRQNGGSGTQTSGSALDTILMNTWASNYNGHLRFGTNNKIQMSVMHDGNVLIGYQTDPNSSNKLSVSGSGYIKDALSVSGSGFVNGVLTLNNNVVFNNPITSIYTSGFTSGIIGSGYGFRLSLIHI